MSASTRERTVMVLGLVALMLFATNLVQFAKNQFFGHDRHEVADMAVEHRHDIVVAPMAPFPPQHRFEMQRAIEMEALAHADAQLAEEAALLAEESARLAAEEARLEAVLAAPPAVFEVERIRVGDMEVSVVVKS